MVHTIPLDVLIRYPKAFTRAELEAPENIRRVSNTALKFTKTENTDEYVIGAGPLLDFYDDWSTFFARYRTASRADLLTHKSVIQKRYKGLFI